MSSKPEIGYIEVRVFAHATEEEERVQAAVRNILPVELSTDVIFEKHSLTGHHGNPIVFFETDLTDKKTLPLVLKKFGATLGSLDKEILGREMSMHLEKSNLFLRFDKQLAYLGKLSLALTDPIHFKVHFKNKRSEEIVEICKRDGLIP